MIKVNRKILFIVFAGALFLLGLELNDIAKDFLADRPLQYGNCVRAIAQAAVALACGIRLFSKRGDAKKETSEDAK